MSQAVTLEVPDSIIRYAQETAKRTGHSLETVLAQWLERGSVYEAVTPLTPDMQHHIYTPFGGEDTAQALLDYLRSEALTHEQFEAKVRSLHEQFLRGEFSQSHMAHLLGISRLDLINLLDAMGLPSANV